MKPVNAWELDLLIESLSGPACCLINDGDYDRCLVLPDGRCYNNDDVERTI